MSSPSAIMEKLEPLSDYCAGGYHPVHIGDRFNESQYAVVNKLGWGAYSTVWLATDTKNAGACVVLSISKGVAADSYSKHLIAKMDYLKSGSDTHHGKANLLFPIDSFSINGPNGQHFCLVMPFEGQTISRATNRAQGAATRPLPLSHAKKAVLDLGNGISYMHELQMTHNDLHPANLFLGIPSDQPWALDKFESICGQPRMINIADIPDTPKSENVPSHLVADAMTNEVDRSLFLGPFKIGDFGLAFRWGEASPKMATNGPYIVPEQNASAHVSAAADVWMFGCAIYQFLSGFDLMGTLNDPSLKMLHQMMEVLGKPPTWMLESWRSMHGESNIRVVENPSWPLDARVKEIRVGNLDIGMKPRTSDFSEEEIATITVLLRYMMHFDPAARPTIEQVLNHPSMEYFREHQ